MAYYLDTDVTYLKGVGPKWGDKLHRFGFRTLKDLVSYYPRTYEDRRHQRKISSLNKGERVYVCGEIVNLQKMFRGPGQRMHIMTIKDDTGYLFCRFFRVPYRTYFEKFHVGQKVLAFGLIGEMKGRKEISHPELTLLSEFKEENFMGLLPIYSQDEELNSKRIHKWILSALQFLEDNPDKKNFNEEFEYLPDWVLAKNNLINRYQALKQIHNPDLNKIDDYFKFQAPAQSRFIFDEFFQLELYLIHQKMKLQQQEGIKLKPNSQLTSQLLKKFGYELTQDQKKAFQEILKDFSTGIPMNRLLQGDVGSGKTAVIFLAMLSVVECGFQSVLMAPTEVLAEQHFKGAIKLFSDLGIKIGFLSSKIKSKEKTEIYDKISKGELQIIIGTHALLEDSVVFKNLALVVVDEQHRFGVEQRQKLKSKSQVPHFLMVTATPIPRTLAMTAYGDLDLTFLLEKPPGRSPIQTKIVMENQREQLYQFMFEQIEKGRQAFIIYPLVEESEKLDLKDVTQAHQQFVNKYPKINWGLLHGKMSSDEKQKIMEDFRLNKIQVLLSTTVIEVGIDVPNANLIIIEHAERFGLSQLHQLRGRVGRGSLKGFCALIPSHQLSPHGLERLKKLESTNDGLELAEWDLEFRGAGQLLGSKQSGVSDFKMANLIRDKKILVQAREAAIEVLSKDPHLHLNIHKKIKILLEELQKHKA